MSVVDPIRDDRGWAFREGEGSFQRPWKRVRFLQPSLSRDGFQVRSSRGCFSAVGQDDEAYRQ